MCNFLGLGIQTDKKEKSLLTIKPFSKKTARNCIEEDDEKNMLFVVL